VQAGIDNVMTYFRILSKAVRDADYAVGVYGNGLISDRLMGENPTNEKLVDYVWLTASAAHKGSAQTYNTKSWDILQTKTELSWSINSRGDTISLDTNIQNPKKGYVGFWNRSGQFEAPTPRNVAIHKDVRFLCAGTPTVFADNPTRPGDRVDRSICLGGTSGPYGLAVRMHKTDQSRAFVRVDCNEDGKPDAWLKLSELSERRPEWIDTSRSDRDSAICTR
jgi:hypothetical protein